MSPLEIYKIKLACLEMVKHPSGGIQSPEDLVIKSQVLFEWIMKGLRN